MATNFKEALASVEPFTRLDTNSPLPLRREAGESDPYPVEALGALIGDAVIGVAKGSQVPVPMCAHSALANLALAVQGRANVVLPIQGRDGQAKPISLFFFSVATSGDRKSTADDLLGNRLIGERLAILQDDWSRAFAEYKNADEAYQAARASAKQKAGKGGDFRDIKAALDRLGDAPTPPREHHLVISDMTIEGLFRNFKFGQPSLGLFSTEGGSLVGGHSMNEDNRSKTAGALNNLWDGSSLTRSRAGDGTATLKGRRLSMHVMIQPKVVADFLNDERLEDQGLFSRLLVCAPKSLQGTRLYREPDPAWEAGVNRFSQQLRGLLESMPSGNEDGELNPHAIRMSAGAVELWRRFADNLESQQGEDGALFPVRGIASKAPENAARLAAVMGLAENPLLQEIDRSLMERGVALAQWYVEEWLRLKLDECVSPEIRKAEALLSWLRSQPFPVEGGHKIFPLVDVYQRGPGPLRDKATAKKALDVLVEHRWVQSVDGARHFLDPARGNQVPRREVYRLMEG